MNDNCLQQGLSLILFARHSLELATHYRKHIHEVLPPQHRVAWTYKQPLAKAALRHIALYQIVTYLIEFA